MKEQFKKGQMIPKRLNMVFTHRKVQHQFKFNCDVIIDGRTIIADNGEFPVIFVPHYAGSRVRRNGTKQRHRVLFKDINIKISGSGDAIFFVSKGYNETLNIVE